jgi:hypothetical protein
MHHESLKNQIFDAQSKDDDHIIIKEVNYNQGNKNELVFFFKPESFDVDHDSEESLIDMVEQKFDDFDIEVSGSILINGTKLKELGIMDRHYGYINLLSKRTEQTVSQIDYDTIASMLKLPDLSNYKVLGGHRFLEEFPNFDEASLNELWLSKHSLKLRSGFYFEKYLVNGDNVIIINGFHPSQLLHFTRPDHRIVVMLLHTDTDWKILKNDMAGATFPEMALAGSIRSEIFNHKEKYGVSRVTVSNNFVHLSAGPFEAMFEVNNFISTFAELGFNLKSTNVARMMIEKGLKIEDVKFAMQNPVKEINGKKTNLFTITEDKNTDEAIDEYIKHFKS